MAREEIADKIQTLLTTSGSWSEPTAVYFMVEVRKLLDHHRAVGQTDSTHLRFYCDWVVHISKDRADPSTIEVLEALQEQVEAQLRTASQIAAQSAIDFAYFESMKAELADFLTQQGIDASRIRDLESWSEFVSVLVKALENQPLTVDPRHGLNITRITFLPSAPRCVIMHVDFGTPVESNDGQKFHWFELKNVY